MDQRSGGKTGGTAEELCPTVPWPSVRALLRNLLRHDYDRVDAVRVWLMIEDDLGPAQGRFATGAGMATSSGVRNGLGVEPPRF